MAINKNVLAEKQATVLSEDGNTMYATIQMRHGKEADMDKSKFVPAELGVATDTKKMVVAFAPNDTKEVAFKDDLDGLINKNQGTENSGKVLVVGKDGNVIPGETPIKIDSTLTQSGQAADAKATGDKLSSLSEDIENDKDNLKLVTNGENYYNNQYANFSLGKITSQGLTAQDGITAYTKNANVKGDYIYFDDTIYKVDVLCYDNQDDVISYAESGYIESSPFSVISFGDRYLRFNIRRKDGGEISSISAISPVYAQTEIENNLIKKEEALNIIDEEINAKGQSIKTYVSVGIDKDYKNLRECFESIMPTRSNNFVVLLDSGTYDIKSLYSENEISESSFKGLFIPDYTELIGLGGKENTILVWDNSGEAKNNRVSTLNIRNVAKLKGVTIKSNRIRYAVHDDFAVRDEENIRICEDCHFISTDGAMDHCYGAGEKGSANWLFKNCIFECPNTMNSFMQHNNIDVSKSSYLEFDNCKFVSYVALSSLNNGTTAINNVVFKGCRGTSFSQRKIRLNENSASLYGSGIKYKISGYSNDFTNENVSIDNTDEVDYSDYIDLI